MSRRYLEQTSFNLGALSPNMQRRSDLDSYFSGLATLENCVILPEGPIRRRAGTRHIVAATQATADERLIPFVISSLTAFILEFSNNNIRVFKDNALVTGPINITTTYTTAQLRDIMYAVDGPEMTLVHPDHPPRRLIYVSDTVWRLEEVKFRPPPTAERGRTPAASGTLSLATVGTGRTWTSSVDTFEAMDVGRVLIETDDIGEAVITGTTGNNVATVDITVAFSGTSISSGSWAILGSPMCELRVDDERVSEKTGYNVGDLVNIFAVSPNDVSNTNEIVNGTLVTNLTNWTDKSGVEVTSGLHTDATTATDLRDTAANFPAEGVRIGMRCLNAVDTCEATVFTVSPFRLTFNPGLYGGTNDAFAQNDVYEVYETGGVVASSEGGLLHGGVAGRGWLEQTITLDPERWYSLLFEVKDYPLSCMIGNGTGTSDILPERSYPLGKHQVFFQVKASGEGTPEIAFRNNQNFTAKVTNITLHKMSFRAFTTAASYGLSDVGKYIYAFGGVIEITAMNYLGESVTGIVRKPLTNLEPAPIGTWTLEEPSWNATLGYPRAVAYFERRLYLAGTAGLPTTVWGSALDNPINHARGVEDNDAVEFVPRADGANAIEWLVGENDLLAGTNVQELVISSGTDSTITATGVLVTSPTRRGSARVRPVQIGSVTLFVQRDGRRIREFALNEDTGTRQLTDVTRLIEGYFDGDIVEMAYQQSPHSRLYVLTTAGTIYIGTYVREDAVIGFSKMTTQGTVLSVASVPAGATDVVTFIVARNGTNVIEFMDELTGFYSQALVDASTTRTGGPHTTITVGSFLDGETLEMYGDGAVYDDAVPAAGVITTESFTVGEAGYGFASTVDVLQPPDTRGRVVENQIITIHVTDTVALNINGDDIQFDPPTMDAAPTAFTGDKTLYLDEATGGSDGVTIAQSTGLPFQIDAIARIVRVSDD